MGLFAKAICLHAFVDEHAAHQSGIQEISIACYPQAILLKITAHLF